MGRINLTALRVRRRALADLQSNKIQPGAPVWLYALADVPPAQILTRQQPQQHSVTQIRTQTLADGRTEQVAIEAPGRTKKSGKKASRLFAPVEIKYEEDELRKQFFQDHPWELARPRTVLETTGDQHKESDYSTGLRQPGVPLSGESVIQRQLYLLENTPDITREESYDIARREFYILRRQQATRRRVAKEESLHMGATPEVGPLTWGMKVENKQYDDWERWARGQIMDAIARNAAFSGEVAPAAEQKILGAPGREEVSEAGQRREIVPGRTPGSGSVSGRGRPDPFGTQSRRQASVVRGTI